MRLMARSTPGEPVNVNSRNKHQNQHEIKLDDVEPGVEIADSIAKEPSSFTRLQVERRNIILPANQWR